MPDAVTPTTPPRAAPDGLTTAEAAARLAVYGPNTLPEPVRPGLAVRIVRQLREPLALLLLAAAAISGIALAERLDAIVISAIVVLNATIAIVQEGRASRALEALEVAVTTDTTTVRRDGVRRSVPTGALVPGDLIELAAGDRVPADVRLVDADRLTVDESLLTGESLPVDKRAPRTDGDDGGAGERLLAGTLVLTGSCAGVVTGTGATTTLGEIAAQLAVERRRPTPLQRELARLGRRLGGAALLVAAVVFVAIVGLGAGDGRPDQAFLTAVALAVAAVPEGLAAVTTVALALGVRAMAARGAIVRRLPAVETLGAVTVLAIDKTGTVTHNRMVLDDVVLIDAPPTSVGALPPDLAGAVLEPAILCNDAEIDPPLGDPLERAILEAAGRDAVLTVRAARPRLAVEPFDADRRWMSTLHATGRGAGSLLAVKGAPEVVVPRCVRALSSSGARVPLATQDQVRLLDIASDLAGGGRRVLAVARADLDHTPADAAIEPQRLDLVALVGLRDPVRSSAGRSVDDLRDAGIRLIMATGDHPGTAAAVANEIGLAAAGEAVMTGTALAARPGDAAVDDVTVYARVDPTQKLDLVERLQRAGHVVAMTGDGVNDAAALRRADIGVALGASGSQVAREAADLVITDDDLGTIAHAVRAGRGIYDDLRQVVDYLLSANLSEIVVVLAALAVEPGAVVLLPLQLLWINLMTDGLPAIALGLDPPSPGVMRRSPRPPAEPLLGARRWLRLIGFGGILAAATLAAYVIARDGLARPPEVARTVLFVTLVLAQLAHAYTIRLWSAPHGRRGERWRWLLGNRWLAAAVAGAIGLQWLVVSVPPVQEVFRTAAMAPGDWALAAVAGVVPAVALSAFERARRGPHVRG